MTAFMLKKNCTNCAFCLKEGLDLNSLPGAKFKLTEGDRKKLKERNYDFLKVGHHISYLACYNKMFDEAMDGSDRSKIRKKLSKTRCHMFYDYKKAPETATFDAILKLKEYEKKQSHGIVALLKKPIFWIVVLVSTTLLTGFINILLEENKPKIIDLFKGQKTEVLTQPNATKP